MSNTISKAGVGVSGFYIWQAEAYGKTIYFADNPCSIYTTRPMPCTPSGDHLCDCATVTEALLVLGRIAGKSLDEARALIAQPEQVETPVPRVGGITKEESLATPSAGTIDTAPFRRLLAQIDWKSDDDADILAVVAHIMDWHSAGVAAARLEALTFANEGELIAMLDSLYATEGKAITNRKFEPAQRAIRALASQPATTAQTDEVTNELSVDRDAPLRGAPAATDGVAAVVLDETALRDAVAEGLKGLWGCGRVWSAWHVGTMSEDDFYPADETDECIDGVMDAIRSHFAAAAAPVAQAPTPTAQGISNLALAWYDNEQAEGGITRDSFHLFVLKHIAPVAAPTQVSPVLTDAEVVAISALIECIESNDKITAAQMRTVHADNLATARPALDRALSAERQPQPADDVERDAARFVKYFTVRQTDSNALIELELRSINGDYPTLDEWRIGVDTALATQQQGERSDE